MPHTGLVVASDYRERADRRVRRWCAAVSVLTLAAAVPVLADLRRAAEPIPNVITGPYASLLAASADLGPARTDHAQLTAALRRPARPAALIDWARRQDLQVRWQPGRTWAIIEGTPAAISGALDVAVHDYRGRLGQIFYASPQRAEIPDPLRGEVAELGRILGYIPHHEARPPMPPRDVPDQGITPAGLVRTYNAQPLHDAGYTGKGSTVLVFAFDGFDQSDLDAYATAFNLPRFTPEVLGGMPAQRNGEATMDLEAIHAFAPDAKKVLVNARRTVEGEGTFEKIGAMMDDARRRFPGAVWSFSIGWGCDKLITAADLLPVRSALADAQRDGTTAFNASGDLAGLECKGGADWSSPPSPDDIGLDSVASVPEMTDVGGTTLSTDASGDWLAEQSWFDPPLSHGTGGGVSALFERPTWQRGLEVVYGTGRPRSTDDRTTVGATRRLTPDIAALADPFTGMKIVFGGQIAVGGGTSLAAPIWAGLAAAINQYLIDNGGRRLGDLNPLLYEIAQGAKLPAFHDVTLGGNAVDDAGPGYDLVTGLGTPHADNLARDLLALQKTIEGR